MLTDSKYGADTKAMKPLSDFIQRNFGQAEYELEGLKIRIMVKEENNKKKQKARA